MKPPGPTGHPRLYASPKLQDGIAKKVSRGAHGQLIMAHDTSSSICHDGGGATDSPSSVTTQGAAPLVEQSSWLLRTPLMQQSVLSKLFALPEEPQPAPPHWRYACKSTHVGKEKLFSKFAGRPPHCFPRISNASSPPEDEVSYNGPNRGTYKRRQTGSTYHTIYIQTGCIFDVCTA